jgi:hypothetical protein
LEFLPDHYRHNAAKCMALAQKTEDLAVRTELLAMAEAWHEMARLAEGDSYSTGANDDLPHPAGAWSNPRGANAGD